jgi:ectoine hydroxylase-related dioxygenase (phytanoyl-CoA dioxygenase family)
MLETSALPELVADLWGSSDVWFMYEQIFLKEGGESRRTPWHQWISFDAVSQADSLEFVRGSHKGPLYDGSRFELNDDTAPLYRGNQLPRLPAIEDRRGDFPIVSFAVSPGDVIVFHPAMLHGGAPTRPGTRRRTLSLRFFGRGAVYEKRPLPAGPPIPGLHEGMKPGDPFRNERFLKLLPRAA